MCTPKRRALSYIGAEKITFPPKPDIQTDRHTDRRTDICVYRVASLLKNMFSKIKNKMGWEILVDKKYILGKAPNI